MAWRKHAAPNEPTKKAVCPLNQGLYKTPFVCMLLLSMKRVVLVIAACALLLTTSFDGCKDPSDYAPQEDTLIPPPGPPQLLAPIDYYVFMDPNAALGSLSFYIPVTLSWDTVDGAEAYVLEITIAALPPNTWIIENNDYYFLIHDDASKLCDYKWRVRAGSTQWDGMTDWSEERRFEARLRPFGPSLLSPVNYLTITVDTLPALVELVWSTVCDEQFYLVKICKGAQLIDSITAYTNMFECLAEDTGTYSWQIWADSPLWQYPSFPSATNYFTIQTR